MAAPRRPPAAKVLAVLAAVATMACAAPAPGVIQYDADACEHCRMTISDPRFAAQLVTRTGKRYLFDDPTCAAAFVGSGSAAPEDVHSIWMNDHAHPGSHVNVDDAVFVVSDRIRAPMNGRTAAFATAADAAVLQRATAGRLARWSDVLRSRS